MAMTMGTMISGVMTQMEAERQRQYEDYLKIKNSGVELFNKLKKTNSNLVNDQVAINKIVEQLHLASENNNFSEYAKLVSIILCFEDAITNIPPNSIKNILHFVADYEQKTLVRDPSSQYFLECFKILIAEFEDTLQKLQPTTVNVNFIKSIGFYKTYLNMAKNYHSDYYCEQKILSNTLSAEDFYYQKTSEIIAGGQNHEYSYSRIFTTKHANLMLNNPFYTSSKKKWVQNLVLNKYIKDPNLYKKYYSMYRDGDNFMAIRKMLENKKFAKAIYQDIVQDINLYPTKDLLAIIETFSYQNLINTGDFDTIILNDKNVRNFIFRQIKHFVYQSYGPSLPRTIPLLPKTWGEIIANLENEVDCSHTNIVGIIGNPTFPTNLYAKLLTSIIEKKAGFYYQDSLALSKINISNEIIADFLLNANPNKVYFGAELLKVLSAKQLTQIFQQRKDLRPRIMRVIKENPEFKEYVKDISFILLGHNKMQTGRIIGKAARSFMNKNVADITQ